MQDSGKLEKHCQLNEKVISTETCLVSIFTSLAASVSEGAAEVRYHL